MKVGNDGEGLHQQENFSPNSEASEADSRRKDAVEGHPGGRVVGGDDNYGGGDGDYLIKEKAEPGVWGADGLLAIRNVKMVLVLAAAVQVTSLRLGKHSFVELINMCYTIAVGFLRLG